jgi:hypothetical protein
MLPIDSTKKYGIMISGGLDSAILLGLVLKELPTINIQPFTIPKNDGSHLCVQNIIDYLNTKYKSRVPYTIHVGDPTVFHREQSKTAVIDIFQNYPVDILFNAINQNPPELNDLPGAPKRDKESRNPKVVLPFVKMYKDEILRLMVDNDLGHLANITHSCTEQSNGRCNKCWQCTERKWAFNKVGKTDTGVL